MENKIYKPKTCFQCPVVEIDKKDKGKIVCGCMRELKAKAYNTQEKLQMWRKCPLAWDKE